MIGLRILGTGSYTPLLVISNEDLERRGVSDSAWVVRNLGIRERRIVANGETTSDMAYHASKAALEASGLAASDVDLIVVGTTTPDRKAPSTACILHNKLGASSCPAFDVSAACSSFLYGLATAAQFLGAGGAKRALVVGADTYSTITDWEHRDSVFFGDAAAAIVVEADSAGSPWYFALSAEGAGWEHFTVPGGGAERPMHSSGNGNCSPFFKLNGPELHTYACRTIPEVARRVLGASGMAVHEVDIVVPHQASIKILDSVREIMGFPRSKLETSMELFGNTAAASIPLTLDLAVRSGRIRRGMVVLFLAFGAGVTYGAGLGRF